MAYTIHSTVVGVPPDLTPREWIAELAGTPAAPEAVECYGRVAKYGVSLRFARAVFRHESSDGTEGICKIYQTKSPGNTRSSRTGKGVLVTTEKGQYVKYDSWADGFEDLAFRLVDPAFRYATEGRTTIIKILQIFAPPHDGNDPDAYARAVAAHMNKMGTPDVTAQIPGFKWHPAASDHYSPGRSQKVIGGAQHYSDGTNSLPWLTTTSDPPVSAHFLVKHDPTLADRGWQLVNMGDTAWTTGAVVNPKTVSIEYEHKAHQPISDDAYEVLAQTWADITRFVRDHNLGNLDVAGVRGHRDWVGDSRVCPDGIDVARIERRRKEILAGGSPQGVDPLNDIVPDPWASQHGYWRKQGIPFGIPRVAVRHIEAYGGIPAFGYLISGVFQDDDGKLVIYTERQRIEIGREYCEGEHLGLKVLLERHPDRKVWD